MKGFLRAFARTAASSAQFLNKVAALGIPMVGSTLLVLCYRDEYVKALGPAAATSSAAAPGWLLSLPCPKSLPLQEGLGHRPWYLFALHREDRQALGSR